MSCLYVCGVLLSIAFALPRHAGTPGDLDPTFGAALPLGHVRRGFDLGGTRHAVPVAVRALTDGRIVSAGFVAAGPKRPRHPGVTVASQAAARIPPSAVAAASSTCCSW